MLLSAARTFESHVPPGNGATPNVS
jgi:hypothetical protein